MSLGGSFGHAILHWLSSVFGSMLGYTIYNPPSDWRPQHNPQSIWLLNVITIALLQKLLLRGPFMSLGGSFRPAILHWLSSVYLIAYVGLHRLIIWAINGHNTSIWSWMSHCSENLNPWSMSLGVSFGSFVLLLRRILLRRAIPPNHPSDRQPVSQFSENWTHGPCLWAGRSSSSSSSCAVSCW